MARPIRKTWTESHPDKNSVCCPSNDYDNNSRNYEEIQLGDDKMNTLNNIQVFRINIRFKWRSREGHQQPG